MLYTIYLTEILFGKSISSAILIKPAGKSVEEVRMEFEEANRGQGAKITTIRPMLPEDYEPERRAVFEEFDRLFSGLDTTQRENLCHIIALIASQASIDGSTRGEVRGRASLGNSLVSAMEFARR